MKNILLKITLTLSVVSLLVPVLALAQFDLSQNDIRDVRKSYADILNKNYTPENLENWILVDQQYTNSKFASLDLLNQIATENEKTNLARGKDLYKNARDLYYDKLRSTVSCWNSDGSPTWSAFVWSSCRYASTDLSNLKKDSLQLESSLNAAANAIIKNHETDIPPEQQQQFQDLQNQALNTVTNNAPTIQAVNKAQEEVYNGCSLWSADTLGNCISAGIDWIFAIINALIGLILQFTGWLFNKAIEFSVVNFHDLASSPGIMEIWKMIRDLTNIGFIFMLLYAGFMTLFNQQGGKMNPRTIVVNVFLFALIVNFSAAITRTAIDLSNVPALMLYNQMSNSETGGNANISNYIIQHSSVAGLSTWNYTFNENAYGTNSGNVKSPVLKALSKGLITMVTFIGLIYILATATFNFLLRSFVLLFLILTSPIYFIAKVVPGSTIEKWATRWWKNLKCWCLYAPIYMGGLYLVMALMAQKNEGKIILGGSGATTGIFLEIIWFGLILTLLFTVDKLAKDLGCEMASAGGKFEGKMKGYGAAALKRGRGGLDYTKALPGRAAKATLGDYYVKKVNSATNKIADRSAKWAAAEGTGVGATAKRWIGWGVAPALSKVPDSKFGTSASEKERSTERGNRHKAVMARMNDEQKARYIESLTEGSAKEAYAALDKKDKLNVALAAQKIAAANRIKFEETKIGKARKALKGEAKDELKEQVQKQLSNEMRAYATQKEKTEVVKENGQIVQEDVLDENGNPKLDAAGNVMRRDKTQVVKDDGGKPVMEEVTDEKERYERMTEFLIRQNAEDQKLVFEKMSDIDRARLKFYGEDVIKKLIENDQNIADQIRDELDKYKKENAGASEDQISNKEKELKLAAEVKARAKALDFAALDNSLDGDKREKSDKEYQKLNRKKSKEELKAEIEKIGEDVAAIDQAQKEAITKLLNGFKGNYQELGDLLTTKVLLSQINREVLTDLRDNKEQGKVTNILNVVDDKIRPLIQENPEIDFTDAQIAARIGVNEDLVKETRRTYYNSRNRSANNNEGRGGKGSKNKEGGDNNRGGNNQDRSRETPEPVLPKAPTQLDPLPGVNSSSLSVDRGTPANTESTPLTIDRGSSTPPPPTRPISAGPRPPITPPHRGGAPSQPVNPINANAARENEVQDQIRRSGGEDNSPNE